MKKFLLLAKLKIQFHRLISDLNGTKIAGRFYEKELQKTSQEEFRMEKVIKGKGNKLDMKWRGYDYSFNS